MLTITPPFLKKGDKVLLIATARKVCEEEMTPAINIMKTWGLEVETGKNLYAQHNQFAGTDEKRAADLQQALDHSSARAVIIARGGYGTMRIIDRIDFARFRQHPKWIAGYSDVTVLHNHLFNLGYCSLHSTMPVNIQQDPGATESLRCLLFGGDFTYKIPVSPLNRRGSAKGVMIGGNLSMLYALCGSSSAIDPAGKILFIEDLDEYLYHVDRMMMQLKRAGKLSNLAGLVVGGMTDMRDNKVPFGKSAENIIADAVAGYNYPVCFNFPSGHIDSNLAWYHGRMVELNIDRQGVNFKQL